MEQLSFTFKMGVVAATLAFTVFLFISQIIRIDVAAMGYRVL